MSLISHCRTDRKTSAPGSSCEPFHRQARSLAHEELPVFDATDPNLRFTRHASSRLQQRGIPPWFVALLLRHGKTSHDGHGALLKSIDKDARKRIHGALERTEYARAE